MSQPADFQPALTVRDEPLATRRDVPDLTVRDDALPPQTLMQLPPTLAARYRIVRPLLTAGGEADLLLVEAVADRQQQYIVKIYRYGIVVKPEVLARISAAAPDQVIHLVEYGQADGHGYEVLEYVAAGSLRPWLTAGPLADAQVRVLVQELSLALAVLHQHDVLHRDIKPENVLIRQWEPLRIALTDFGIASVAEATQHFTTTARTLRYAAPEAATGVIGVAADYWSLGMVALEAVSGRHPFAGLSEAVLSYQLVTQPVDCSGVAEPWRTLCRGLLLRDPKQRWGRAEIARWLAGDESLQVAIEALATGEVGHSHRPYKFQGVECWTARQLATQLVCHWDEGAKDLSQGLILPWLRDELRDQDLARFTIQLCGNKDFSEDEKMLRLVVKLAPYLPPIYKGISIAKTDLVVLASKAIQGDLKSASFLEELYNKKLLLIYQEEIMVTAEHKKIDFSWRNSVDIYKKGWMKVIEKGAPSRLQPEIRTVLPALLLMNISEDFRVQLRQKTIKETTKYALGCEWFITLGHPDKAELPHLLVLSLLSQAADQFMRDFESKLAKEIKDLKSEFCIFYGDEEIDYEGKELVIKEYQRLLDIEKVLSRKNKNYILISEGLQKIPLIRRGAMMVKPRKVFAQAQAEELKQRKRFPPDFKKTIELYEEAKKLGSPDAEKIIPKIVEMQSIYSIFLGVTIKNFLSHLILIMLGAVIFGLFFGPVLQFLVMKVVQLTLLEQIIIPIVVIFSIFRFPILLGFMMIFIIIRGIMYGYENWAYWKYWRYWECWEWIRWIVSIVGFIFILPPTVNFIKNIKDYFSLRSEWIKRNKK